MSARKLDLKELASSTPASRDRYVDFLRAFSIAVVVFGHWLLAIIYVRGYEFAGDSALDVIPGLWILTWVLQVMPLFFFVGGFSNLVSWDAARKRGEGYAAFLHARVERLMRPTAVFIGVWTLAALVLHFAAPALSSSLDAGAELIAKPLWFLAVYVLVTAMAPFMLALHRRYGIRVLAVMAVGAVVVDFMRVGGGLTVVGYLNFAFVWLFAHQLGFLYADGTFNTKRPAFFVKMAGLGLALLVALTASGIYSPSMVGTAGEKASNNSPPSVCLIALTLWLVGVAMVVRPKVTAWLARPYPWRAVVAANSVIMTVFLWHLTATLLAVAVLYPLGFPQPEGGSALWWAWRPVWLAGLTLFLAPLVVAFARFETKGLFAARPKFASVSSPRAVAGVAALVTGLAGLAQYGFAMSPVHAPIPAVSLVSAGLAVVGYRLLTANSAA